MKFDGIILAAHRGDKKNYPENTLPAFEAAIRSGVDMIETDIHITADGELVLIHDHNTVRTTGFDGVPREMTLAQLKQLDVGGQFYGQKTDIRIPTVMEFLERIKDTKVAVNWELKDYPETVGEELAFASADKLIDLIERWGMEDRSMVNSFSNRVLAHIYKRCGHKYPIHGQGIGKCSRAKDSADVPDEELFDWCCLYPDERGRNPVEYPENFAYCTEHGILPCVCIPDTVEDYRKAIDMGCRMFTSNDIHKADRILKELKYR